MASNFARTQFLDKLFIGDETPLARIHFISESEFHFSYVFFFAEPYLQ